MGKEKVGRPSKYEGIEKRLDEVEKLAGYGLTETEIADFLGIARSTLSLYKADHPEFSDILKRGKLKADAEVVKSLYKRATGYEYDDMYLFNHQGKGHALKIKKVVLPDVTACAIWLNNRRRQDWRQRVEPIKDEEPASPEFESWENEELVSFIKDESDKIIQSSSGTKEKKKSKST